MGFADENERRSGYRDAFRFLFNAETRLINSKNFWKQKDLTGTELLLSEPGQLFKSFRNLIQRQIPYTALMRVIQRGIILKSLV